MPFQSQQEKATHNVQHPDYKLRSAPAFLNLQVFVKIKLVSDSVQSDVSILTFSKKTADAPDSDLQIEFLFSLPLLTD